MVDSIIAVGRCNMEQKQMFYLHLFDFMSCLLPHTVYTISVEVVRCDFGSVRHRCVTVSTGRGRGARIAS
jgi:hypothetical protein